MKRFLFVAFFFLCSIHFSYSQVYFTNGSSSPIFMAFAYYLDANSYSGWMSKGWYKVEPGEKIQLLSYMYNGDFYYCAQGTDGTKYNGDHSFLVNEDDAFTIKNADHQYVKDNFPSYSWRKMRKVAIKKRGFDLVTHPTHVITFEY